MKELQSLVGKLQHAGKVIRPGRTFLRHMLGLLKDIPRHQKFIQLNTAFRSDLTWWLVFMETWNGISMFPTEAHTQPHHHLFTDASGRLGCGAWADRSWFQLLWPSDFVDRSIAAKELIPIVLACVVWGKDWRNRSVLAHCDNQAVVEVVNAGYSRDADLMQLLRSLFFITAHLGIHLRAIHIPGVDNTGANAISRDNLILFHFQVPEARPSPTPLPQALIDLVVRRPPDWMSPSWSRLFGTSLRLV